MEGHTSAEPRSGQPLGTPFFYGWVIVGVSALTLFFSGPGQTYSVSTFIDSYIGEFGWSRSTISGMYSLGTLSAGLLMGVIGNLFDRWGHRLMTALVAALLGVACLGMTLVNAPIALLAGFFSIRLLGQGSMSLSSGTLVPQWFIRKRGRALSLVSLGGAASSALLPPLNTWMIGAYGWKMGWTVWAVLLWAVMVPMAYLVIRDKPENVGLSPDGEGNRRDLVEVNPVPEESWTVREAVKTRSFWLLLFCVMVPSAIVTGLIFHHISIMGQTGIDAQAAAAVLSTMAIVRLPVVLVTGQIADRASPRLLQATSLGLLLLSMAVLLFINSVQTAVLYGVLTGIMMAFQSIVSGVIWPIYYGRRHLGSIRGLTMMAGVIGSALGPLPYGFAYDLYGGYHEAFVLSLIFPLIGVAAALLAKRPERTASSRGNSYS